MNELSLLLLAAFVYFAPAMVAFFKYHRHAAAIFVVNLFLGWTVVGWVGALAWAALPLGRETPEDSGEAEIR